MGLANRNHTLPDISADKARLLMSLIILAAIAVRLMLVFVINSKDALYDFDGPEYADLSQNIAEGRGYSISEYRWFEPQPPDAPSLHSDLYRPPLIPILGAGLHFLPGEWETWAALLQIAFGVGCVVMAFLIASTLFSYPAGLLAAAGTAVYPYAVLYSSTWATETAFTFLLLATTYTLACLYAELCLRTALLAGVIMGLACLARPNGLVVFVGFAAWLVLAMPKGRQFLCVTLFAVGLTAVIVPWMLRIYRVGGVVVPITAMGPYQLWLGHNEVIYDLYQSGDASRFQTYFDDVMAETRVLETMLRQGITAEPEMGRFWRGRALAYVTANPMKTAELWVRRMGRYWSPWPLPGAHPEWVFWLSTLTLIPMFAFALVGVLAHQREAHRAVLLLLTPPVVGMLGAAPMMFSLRLRFPTMDIFVLILAAAGTIVTFERIRDWFTRKTVFES